MLKSQKKFCFISDICDAGTRPKGFKVSSLRYAQVTLLWEDQSRRHLLASTRLYFLPEDTPKGRTREHGEVGQASRADWLLLLQSN